jgi:hypothetical protein
MPLMWNQGCHKGRFWGKINVRTSFSCGRPFRADVRPRLHLPRGRVFTVRRRGKNRVRADAAQRPRACWGASTRTRKKKKKKKKIKKFFFWFVVAGLAQ